MASAAGGPLFDAIRVMPPIPTRITVGLGPLSEFACFLVVGGAKVYRMACIADGIDEASALFRRYAEDENLTRPGQRVVMAIDRPPPGESRRAVVAEQLYVTSQRVKGALGRKIVQELAEAPQLAS